MAEIIEFQKPTVKQRWTEFKGKVRDWANPKIEWCKEHREVLMVIVPAVISGGVELAKASIRAKDHREERELEEQKLRSAFDQTDGVHLETKHLLNKEEYHSFQELKESGMTTGEALDKLGLLA